MARDSIAVEKLSELVNRDLMPITYSIAITLLLWTSKIGPCGISFGIMYCLPRPGTHSAVTTACGGRLISLAVGVAITVLVSVLA